MEENRPQLVPEQTKKLINDIVRTVKAVCRTKHFREVPDSKYGGLYNNGSRDVWITEVIYNNPATIVFWSDGTKTMARCHPEDLYSPETGLLMAVMKKLTSSTFVVDLMENWSSENGEKSAKGTKVNLKGLRKKLKK